MRTAISIPFHDSPLIIIDILDNFNKFLRDWNYLVVFSVSKDLKGDHVFIEVKNKCVGLDNVYFIYTENRKKYTFDIGLAHLKGVKYLLDIEEDFDFVLFFASNCLFIKAVPECSLLHSIYMSTQSTEKVNYFDGNVLKNRTDSWPSEVLFKNQTELIDFFLGLKCPLTKSLLEGDLYDKHTLLIIISLLTIKPDIFPKGNLVGKCR